MPARSRTWPRPWRPARCGGASGALRPIAKDALWLRELLAEGRLPEAWIALEHVRQWRSRLHLRKALIDQRTQWLLRVRSVLYHHRLSAGAPGEIAGAGGRQSLARLGLPADARERVTVALDMIDTLEREISEIKRSRRRVARHQAGCQALMTQFDVGELIALTLVTELGDVTRMSSSRKAVRFAGIDIGVHRSDQTARVGKLTRQGSSPLRWALYEAAQSATRPRSPDYADYHALKARRLTHTRALFDDRAQKRQAQLPPTAQPRTRRDRTHPRVTRRLPDRPPPEMITLRPAPSASVPPTTSKDPDRNRAAAVNPAGTTDQPSRPRAPHHPVPEDPDKPRRPRSQPNTHPPHRRP